MNNWPNRDKPLFSQQLLCGLQHALSLNLSIVRRSGTQMVLQEYFPEEVKVCNISFKLKVRRIYFKIRILLERLGPIGGADAFKNTSFCDSFYDNRTIKQSVYHKLRKNKSYNLNYSRRFSGSVVLVSLVFGALHSDRVMTGNRFLNRAPSALGKELQTGFKKKKNGREVSIGSSAPSSSY